MLPRRVAGPCWNKVRDISWSTARACCVLNDLVEQLAIAVGLEPVEDGRESAAINRAPQIKVPKFCSAVRPFRYCRIGPYVRSPVKHYRKIYLEQKTK